MILFSTGYLSINSFSLFTDKFLSFFSRIMASVLVGLIAYQAKCQGLFFRGVGLSFLIVSGKSLNQVIGLPFIE